MAEEKKKPEKKIRVFTAKDAKELELMSTILAGSKVLYAVKPLKTGAFRLMTVTEIDDLKRAKLVEMFIQAQTQQ